MPLRVLIVEDDADAAEGLQELVALWGHEAGVATDAAEARAALAARWDVVLLDLGLPDADGVALAGELRARMAADARLIAITGFTDEDLLARTRAAGAAACLTKPVDLDALQKLLAELAG